MSSTIAIKTRSLMIATRVCRECGLEYAITEGVTVYPAHKCSGAGFTWFTTLSLQEALGSSAYIGECLVRPKPLAVAVRSLLRLYPLPSWRQYYYGKLDEYLNRKFGYISTNSEHDASLRQIV